MSSLLSQAIVELEPQRVTALVGERLDAGHDPLEVLAECRQGMAVVGERFQSGEYFLSELLLSAEIFKDAVRILEPHLARTGPPEPTGAVVLATLKGDIHDLGKNILATLLRAHGFVVHDLGVNVPPAVVVDKVREIRPDLVGFSALITTAFESMREAAGLLEQAGLREGVKLMVGGGVTTPAVKQFVGADFQSTDATAGVAYCLGVVGGQADHAR